MVARGRGRTEAARRPRHDAPPSAVTERRGDAGPFGFRGDVDKGVRLQFRCIHQIGILSIVVIDVWDHRETERKG